MMIHRAGTFSTSVNADGYVPFSCEITVVEGESVTRDITMVPVTGDNYTTCLVEKIYGEYSVKAEILRDFRDNVLSKTTEGQKAIKLYYEWSPVIAKMIEKNEILKKKLKTAIDGILPFCNGTSIRKQ